MINDTHRFQALCGHSGKQHYWIEESDGSFTQLHVTDQADSVTVELVARTTGIRVPEASMEAMVRMTYRDLEMFCEVAKNILRARAKELNAEWARSGETHD